MQRDFLLQDVGPVPTALLADCFVGAWRVRVVPQALAATGA